MADKYNIEKIARIVEAEAQSYGLDRSDFSVVQDGDRVILGAVAASVADVNSLSYGNENRLTLDTLYGAPRNVPVIAESVSQKKAQVTFSRFASHIGVLGSAVEKLYKIVPVFVVTGSGRLREVVLEWIKNINNSAIIPGGKKYFIGRGIKELYKTIAYAFFVDGDAFVVVDWINVNIGKRAVSLPVRMRHIDIQFVEYDPDDMMAGIANPTVVTADGEELPLSKDGYFHIKRGVPEYVPYGTPYVIKAYYEHAETMSLRTFNDKAINTALSSFRIIAVGQIRPGHVNEDIKMLLPRVAMLRAKLRSLNNNSDPTQYKFLAWGGTDIELINIPSDIDQIAVDKVSEINEQIKGSIVEDILFGGQRRNSTQASASARFLEREVGDLTDRFSQVINEFIEKIKERNNIKGDARVIAISPLVYVDNPTLNILKALYDRGLLSNTTFLAKLGVDVNEEVDIRQYEDEHGISDILQPRVEEKFLNLAEYVDKSGGR